MFHRLIGGAKPGDVVYFRKSAVEDKPTHVLPTAWRITGCPSPIVARSISSAVQLQGKELSFNNINDTNGAFELVKEFSEPSVVIVKHANPCGVAIDQGSQLATYLKARDCDPVSAFGGIVAFNRPLDGETAAELATTFLEVIVAPGFSAEAKAILGEKKNLRLLQTPEITGAHQPEFDLKKVVGGLLVQDRDLATVGADDLKTVTELTPDAGQIRDLLFAWKVVKHVKSNAIVYVKDGVTVGIGAGQMRDRKSVV